MDNNTAERAIRPFTLGRKNWVNVDSIRVAEASAIMYSLVETAKANGLRVYEYLEYVLTFSPGPKQPRKMQQPEKGFQKKLIQLSKSKSIGIASKMAVSFILWYPCLSTYPSATLRIAFCIFRCFYYTRNTVGQWAKILLQ